MTADPGMNAMDWQNRRTLAASGFTESTVDSPVGTQTFFTAGEGQPMLLLHGAGDSAAAWAKAAPALLATRQYRILIPDLAGHGTSQPHQGPLDMGIFLEGVNAVAQQATGAPLVLIGNSLGAWLAMVWADRNPGQVARVVAVDGSGLTGIRDDLALRPADREEARRLWQTLVDPAYWNVPEMVYDEMIRRGREGAVSRMVFDRMKQFVMDGRLAEFRTPVDLIWGESDGLLPLDYARSVAALLPMARLSTIPGCGHVPQLECADRFNTLLRGLLNQPPPSRKAS
jgi:pimeloyl-ACP methyl ester carboxylesterase